MVINDKSGLSFSLFGQHMHYFHHPPTHCCLTHSLTHSLTAPHTRCPHTLTAHRQFTGRSFVRSFVGSIDRFQCRLVGWLGWLSHPPTHSPQPVTAHSQSSSASLTVIVRRRRQLKPRRFILVIMLRSTLLRLFPKQHSHSYFTLNHAINCAGVSKYGGTASSRQRYRKVTVERASERADGDTE